MSGDLIEIALHEQPLSEAMRNYGLRILLLSVVLSLIVAAFIFAALSRVLVRPMQRLSANITRFAGNPEDAAAHHHAVRASRRTGCRRTGTACHADRTARHAAAEEQAGCPGPCRQQGEP
jgi:hypothetical protein